MIKKKRRRRRRRDWGKSKKNVCISQYEKERWKKNKFKNSRVEQIQYHNSILTVSTSAAREIVRHKKSMWLLSTVPGSRVLFRILFFLLLSVGREMLSCNQVRSYSRACREFKRKESSKKNSRRSMMMMVGMMMMMRPVLDDGRRRCAAIEWRFSDFIGYLYLFLHGIQGSRQFSH